MTSSDNLFFEEYKRLEKLCSDAYSCQNGVSGYIATMEENAQSGQRLVSSWDFDYKMLKRIRWVRNQIAHSPDVFQVCEGSDLSFVREFYSRMITRQDPLSELIIAKKEKLGRQSGRSTSTDGKTELGARTKTKAGEQQARADKKEKKLSNSWLKGLFFVGLLAALLVLLWKMYLI